MCIALSLRAFVRHVLLFSPQLRESGSLASLFL